MINHILKEKSFIKKLDRNIFLLDQIWYRCSDVTAVGELITEKTNIPLYGSRFENILFKFYLNGWHQISILPRYDGLDMEEYDLLKKDIIHIQSLFIDMLHKNI